MLRNLVLCEFQEGSMHRPVVPSTVFACFLIAAAFAFSQGSRGEKYAFLVVCSKYNSTQLRDFRRVNSDHPALISF
jgi:hypothetical protein